MTRYLLATTSVHLTAAAADYLQDRLTPEDEVYALFVEVDDPDVSRDGADALNVARTRFAMATVETLTRTGDPADEILAAAAEVDADELLLAARRGVPGEDHRFGETARQVGRDADRPVVLVPLPDL